MNVTHKQTEHNRNIKKIVGRELTSSNIYSKQIKRSVISDKSTFKILPNVFQQLNYAKIQYLKNDQITVRHIGFSDLKLLLAAHTFSVNGFTRIESIIRRWHSIPIDQDVPAWRNSSKQFRKTVQVLAENGFFELVKDPNGAVVGINFLESDNALRLLNERCITISKKIATDLSLSLEALVVACYFQLHSRKNQIFASEAAADLGIDSRTFSKYARELFKKGYLQKLQVSKKLSRGNVFITVYNLKKEFKASFFTRQNYLQFRCSQGCGHFCNPYVFTLSSYRKHKKSYLTGGELLQKGSSLLERLVSNYKTINASMQRSDIRATFVQFMRNDGHTFAHENKAYSYFKKITPRIFSKQNAVLSNSLSIDTVVDDMDFIEQILVDLRDKTGKKYSLEYTVWRLKQLSFFDGFSSKQSAAKWIFQMLKTDTRNPYTTLNWDVNYRSKSSIDEMPGRQRPSDPDNSLETCLKIGSLMFKLTEKMKEEKNDN